MPAPLAVDREAARTLAVAVGVREAARQMNLNEDTVAAWSRRDRWFAQPTLPPTIKPVVQAMHAKPADALANIISERKHKYRAGMSKYASDAAAKLEKSNGELKLSRPAKDIADIAAKLWPEQNSNTSGININVLTGSADIRFEQ